MVAGVVALRDMAWTQSVLDARGMGPVWYQPGMGDLDTGAQYPDLAHNNSLRPGSCIQSARVDDTGGQRMGLLLTLPARK